MEHQASRRDLLLTSLMATLPFGVTSAVASPLNPEQTIIKAPDTLPWKSQPNFPPNSVDNCTLTGDTSAPGLYYARALASRIHERAALYSTDRYCIVLSGTWWCNSGADFDPAACVPVSAGSYVHRVALTPHYDGVIRSHNEPAVIAICGIGPVNFKLSDPSKPGWREV
jgi:hypothetical protein